MRPNISRKRLAIGLTAIALVAVMAGPALAQLLVKVSVTGTVVGQTKELTISAQTAVNALGTATILPICASAPATSFADTATATLAFGASLQSNTDYETFFCLGNIGASSGIVHVTVTSSDSATYTIEQCSQGIGSLTVSAEDGASIGAGAVQAIRVHVHTPTVGLNAQSSLNGIVQFSLS